MGSPEGSNRRGMRQVWPALPALLALCVALCLASSAARAEGCNRALRMAVEHRPPYLYMDSQGQMRGGDFELIKAIVEQAGCKLSLQAELPRKRRYAMFIAGEIDLLASASDTPDRRRVAWFTAPYYTETVALFVLPEQLQPLQDITGFGDVLKRRLSVVSQSFGWYGDDFEGHKPALREAGLLSHYDQLTSAIGMLQLGRGQMLLADRAATRQLLRERGLSFAELPYVPVQAPAHIMLSRQSVSEAEFQAIDRALKRLEERGTLRQIRLKYGLQ